jgi:hypothetical protein
MSLGTSAPARRRFGKPNAPPSLSPRALRNPQSRRLLLQCSDSRSRGLCRWRASRSALKRASSGRPSPRSWLTWARTPSPRSWLTWAKSGHRPRQRRGLSGRSSAETKPQLRRGCPFHSLAKYAPKTQDSKACKTPRPRRAAAPAPEDHGQTQACKGVQHCKGRAQQTEGCLLHSIRNRGVDRRCD